MNYEEKFHTLLHLDEISGLLHIRQYDQDRTCFIPNREFLMLEVENLAERRPSIVLGEFVLFACSLTFKWYYIILYTVNVGVQKIPNCYSRYFTLIFAIIIYFSGDRIMASDPLGQSNEEYEGNVFKVGSKHVYLKFSCMFHGMYRGEDYSVRVIPGRSAYKRQHHAVYLVARNLGKEWLFPTKVVEKPPQINFVYSPYKSKVLSSPVERVTSPDSPRQLTAPELIKKAREAKRKAERERLNRSKQEDSDGSISSIDSSSVSSEVENLETKALKLDWYTSTDRITL